jgi:hypothetical protein
MSVGILHCGTQTRIFLYEKNDVAVIVTDDADNRPQTKGRKSLRVRMMQTAKELVLVFIFAGRLQ